ncbi:MAG: hypothetical protein JWN43_1551 [Gammaproteobacteria bacterium]|nr:hypothetical protein [Gammaproteobacteria bacterium]
MLVGALLLAVMLTGAWEWHWRAFGAVPSFLDDDALWARQRRRVDAGEEDATVLIGSSRTFFDVQLPIWERLSGRRPVQLAIVGTSPLFALEDLANDPAYSGRLVIGIAPDIFFSGFEYRRGFARYVRKESPSQRIGKILSMHLVEPWFAFYNPDFALFTVLRRQPWPERQGLSGHSVRMLSVTEADRNNHMWSKLETDSSYRALVRSIWAENFNDPPPTAQEAAENRRTLSEQITRTAAAVARLRERNIPVIFVREPSNGDFLAYEDREFPRKSTWDELLEKAHVPGIHFQDYPELQDYDLPDWSHMTRASAERYTEALYRIIEHSYAPPAGTRW